MPNSVVLKRQAAAGETPPSPQQSFPSAAALSFIFHQQEHDPASVHRHLCRNGSHHDPEVCWYCLYGVYVQALVVQCKGLK